VTDRARETAQHPADVSVTIIETMIDAPAKPLWPLSERDRGRISWPAGRRGTHHARSPKRACRGMVGHLQGDFHYLLEAGQLGYQPTPFFSECKEAWVVTIWIFNA